MKTSTADNPKPPTPRKILLIGPPGSRKTTLGLQFPDVHVMDCDRNLDGPSDFLRKGMKDIKPLLPTLSFTWDDIRKTESGEEREVDDCFDELLVRLRMFKTDKAYQERKTVFIDSLSHVNEFIIRKVLKVQDKTRKNYVMEARDWTPFKSFAYSLLVGRLEETGKTVLCSCHEISITEAAGSGEDMMKQKVVGVEPFFQGKVGDTIGAFFTDVWRMTIRHATGGKTETWLQTIPPITNPKCEHLKNSLGMPAELNITEGFKALEPYLKGKV